MTTTRHPVAALALPTPPKAYRRHTGLVGIITAGALLRREFEEARARAANRPVEIRPHR